MPAETLESPAAAVPADQTNNPNQKRINELRERLSDIYHRRYDKHPGWKHATNIGDSIPGIKAEIRRLGGNPHVYAQRIG